MTSEPVRAGADWLALREDADADARSVELVELLRPRLPVDGLQVRDLGCGTGSMARWLAPRLPGPQHWVLYDRDTELLDRAAADPPRAASDGATVTVDTRRRDITRLEPAELAGAHLVTASALVDMMTADELDRLVATCASAGCPVLVTLSVVGRVELTPADPLDRRVADAFNAHQHRDLGAGALLGPDAADAVVEGLSRAGCEVAVRASPWRLGRGQSALAAEWFTGWFGAACEQQPALREAAGGYARCRLAQAAKGTLTVVVHHEDLLAVPAGLSAGS
jgi:SAM-dependent methyltransferase